MDARQGANVATKATTVPMLVCPGCAMLPAGEFCPDCREATTRLVAK